MKIKNINTYLSTFNFVLFFIGYQLATSLLLPVSSDIEGISRTVTVPYRAFALLISLIVIFLNAKKKGGKTHPALKILIIYWIALVIRIFYDTNIRIDVHLNDTRQLWLYIFGIILPAMYSVMKSYQEIDYNKALKWVYFGTVLSLILSLFNNAALLMDTSEMTGRASGNIGLRTISFGHLGTMGLILSLFILSKGGMNLIKKFFVIAIIMLSFFVMLRAGSRSPVLALVVVFLFWLFARGKNVVLGTFITVACLTLLVIFIEPILNFMGNISPIIETRLRLSIFEGYTSGRDDLYKEAFHIFLDNPLLGGQFALFNQSNGFIYSHNIILDSLMGLGFLGGVAIIYILWIAIKKSYSIVKQNDPHFWISLILVQQIVLSMLSGAFYYNQILNILLVFVYVYARKNSNNIAVQTTKKI